MANQPGLTAAQLVDQLCARIVEQVEPPILATAQNFVQGAVPNAVQHEIAPALQAALVPIQNDLQTVANNLQNVTNNLQNVTNIVQNLQNHSQDLKQGLDTLTAMVVAMDTNQGHRMRNSTLCTHPGTEANPIKWPVGPNDQPPVIQAALSSRTDVMNAVVADIDEMLQFYNLPYGPPAGAPMQRKASLLAHAGIYLTL